jgi:hypothetical protein
MGSRAGDNLPPSTERRKLCGLEADDALIAADTESADIMFQAVQREYYLVSAEETRALGRVEDIRQLHLTRLLQGGKKKQSSARGPGRPPKVDPQAVKGEKERRLTAGGDASSGALAKHFHCAKRTINSALGK